MRHANLKTILLATGAILTLSAFAGAQGKKALAEKPYEDKKWGFAITAFDKWNLIPPEPKEPYELLRFVSPSDIIDPKLLVSHTPFLQILRFDPTGKSAALLDQDQKAAGGDGPKTGDDNTAEIKELREKLAYKNFEQFIAKESGFQMMDKAKTQKIGKLEAKIYNYKQSSSATKLFVRHYVVAFTNEDKVQIVLRYAILERAYEDWKPLFDESVKSFRFIKAAVDDEAKLAAMSPIQRDEFRHTEDCKRTGWQFTKTKNYFIKYDIDKKDFIDSVKERVEAIRTVFVKDFGDREATEFPVVRICKSTDEYHQYSNTGAGVGGHFNPSSKELVLPCTKDVNINETWIVLNHESFHQFIWFRFGEVDPHSWYNEGTGDYYGGHRFKGAGKFELKALSSWAGGYDRVSIIKDAVKREVYIPIDKILRYSQGDYYNGPSTGGYYSHGLMCYSEGWSIIYFLRQGKEMKHTPWKAEWEQILPTYFDTVEKTKDRDKAIEVALKDLKGDAMVEFEKSWKEFVKKLD